MLNKILNDRVESINTKEKLHSLLNNYNKPIVYRNMALQIGDKTNRELFNIEGTILVLYSKLYIVYKELEQSLEEILKEKVSLEFTAYKRTTLKEERLIITGDIDVLDEEIKRIKEKNVHQTVEFHPQKETKVTIGYYSTKETSYDERSARAKGLIDIKTFVPIYKSTLQGQLFPGHIFLDPTEISCREFWNVVRDNSVCSIVDGSIEPGKSYVRK